MRQALLIAAVVLAWGAQPAWATRYVDDSGSNAGNNDCALALSPCATIQQGISKAAAGETVLVGGGTYNSNPGIVLGNGKSIAESNFRFGPPTAGAAVIDNSIASPAISVQAGNPAGKIEGFDIASTHQPLELGDAVLVTGNTLAQANPPTSSGAHIRIPAGSPQIVGNTFDDTNATGTQLGVLSQSTGSPRVLGNDFDNFYTAVAIENGGSATIADNTVVATRIAAVTLNDATATITGNVFREGLLNARGVQVVEQVGPTATGATLRRNSFLGHPSGIDTLGSLGAVTSDSDLFTGGQFGISSTDPGNGGGNVTVSNATFFGQGGGSIGADGTLVTVRSSILSEAAFTQNGGTCAISFSRGPAGGSGPCATFTTNADPQFVNPGPLDGDYRLTPGSPLIEAGDPTAPPAGALDRDGRARALDGDKDCRARRDIGAYEFAPAAPLPNCSPPAKPPAVAERDTLAPAVTRASLLRRVFRVGRGRTRVSARAKRGTALRFRLSERADVTITIRRRLNGRLSNGRCRNPTRALRKRKRCVRRPRAGALRRALGAGRHDVAFTGRIGRKALRPGSYDATIQARDSARNLSKPVRLRFRVVK